MGGFNPISAVLAPFSSTIGFAQDTARSRQSYQQARDNYDLNERSIAEQARLEQEKIEADAGNAARARQQALKRTMAKQRAQYGAQGIDTSDGSGEAVLLGLLSENEEEKQYRDKLDTIRRESLAQQTQTKRQRNLLNLHQSQQNTGARFTNSLIDTIL